METAPARAWFVLELLLWLFTLSGDSAPDSAPAQVMVSSLVGAMVVLPCSCPTLGPQAHPHLQWCLESTGPTLEHRGQQTWTVEELGTRAEVLESGPGTRNCSLLLRDLQVTDTGLYHTYLLQDQDQTKTRTRTGVFICSVKLLVFGHSSVEIKSPGEDLLLELHTPHAMTLVFQGSNSSEWRPLWQRGAAAASRRVVKDPEKEQLRLRAVSRSDQGLYKVLDLNGLTVSSTRLSLDQHEAPGPNMDQHEAPGPDLELQLLLRGGAVRLVSCSLLLVMMSLLDL